MVERGGHVFVCCFEGSYRTSNSHEIFQYHKSIHYGGIDGSARVWQPLKYEERVLPICELHVGSGLISSVALSELNYVIGISYGTVYILGGTGRREEEVPTPSLVAKFQHTRWPITIISSLTELEPAAVWATADDKGTIMIYNVVKGGSGYGSPSLNTT